MLGHEGAFGTFPAGRVGGPNNAAESGFVTILPRIEEQPLYDTLKLTGTYGVWHPNSSQLNATGSACWGPDAATRARVQDAVKQRPAVFLCPADSTSQPLNTDTSLIVYSPFVRPGAAATASYAMCNGKTPNNFFQISDGLNMNGPYSRTNNLGPETRDGHNAGAGGIFDSSGMKRLREDVSDGLSKTFMLGETIDTHTASGLNLWSWAATEGLNGPPLSVGAGNSLPDNSALRCCLCRPNSRVYKQPCSRWALSSGSWVVNTEYVISTSGSTGKYKGFDSLHPGGAVFVFGDGRHQFIDDQIDLDVYKALSTAMGQEGVDVP